MTTSTTLDRLAAQLADAVLAGQLRPCIAGVPTAGHELHVATLDEGHPVTVLRGLHAPADWDAVVVVTTGRVVSAEPGAPAVEPGAIIEPGTAVVVAAVTGRSGPDRSIVLGADGRVVLERTEAVGLVPDACRRFLRRGTPPPDVPVTSWWATDWLLDVAAVLDGGRPTPMAIHDVVALHPAVELEELPTSTADLVAFVVARGWDHAHLTGWAGVRRSVAEGLIVDPRCPPDLARWYDTGSFSRHALAARTSPGAVLASISGSLPAPVVAALRRVLTLWKLDPGR